MMGNNALMNQPQQKTNTTSTPQTTLTPDASGQQNNQPAPQVNESDPANFGVDPKSQPMSVDDFADLARLNTGNAFEGWTNQQVAQGAVNKYPVYRNYINEDLAPQAQADKWNSLGTDVGGVFDFLFNPVEKAGATMAIGAQKGLADLADAGGSLLNMVGMGNEGKSLTDWGNVNKAAANMRTLTGVPNFGGGTTLPLEPKKELRKKTR